MKSNLKSFLVGAAGFVAILLTALVYNVSLGVLILSLAALFFVKPLIKAIPSKNPLDAFVRQTITSIEAVPEIIEKVEATVHETIDVAKETVSNTWSSHQQEIASIERELAQFTSSKEQ
ncbi:MAG: hypothetical protein ABIF92_01860 [archaeon]